MLATLVPLFDEAMTVRGYSLFCQKKNLLLEPAYMSAAGNSEATSIIGLDVLDSAGLDTLVNNSDIFLPITNVTLFADIVGQCYLPHDRLVLLIDTSVRPDPMYIDKITELKRYGFRFAMQKIKVQEFEIYRPILSLMDYIFLNHQKIIISKAKIYFNQLLPKVKLIASDIESQAIFDSLKVEGGYALYEGSFYRMPVTKGKSEVSPLKMNYIQLLNIVNDDDFELTAAADIIGRDTALIIALLKLVNKLKRSTSEITSIRHAAAMLGQKELKKWITTAITQQLCADRPSEIMRVSLLRAKFAENLAGSFELGMFGSELFLLGLFSVVDLILGKPMSEALELLKVSQKINQALIDNDGPYADVLNFIKLYESADWQEVSRLMIVRNIDMDTVYSAYLESLEWYRDLFTEVESFQS